MAQESWKEIDETECQKCESPILCANNCGFFGSAMTNNLCSKCYRDLVLKQQVMAAVQSPAVASSSSLLEPFTNVPENLVVENAGNPGKTSEEGFGIKLQHSRCLLCRKKVGLMGFICRCENTFCSTHRYPETHECAFDYKTAGREAIAKENPVVKAEKIEKI